MVEDLAAILRAARPEVVYLHNLADKHDTHVGVALRAIAALRAVRARDIGRSKVYGCEVWRDLDWLPDDGQAGAAGFARAPISPPRWWGCSIRR